MSGSGEGLSDFDERLLQGVLARVWRRLAEHNDSESQLNTAESYEELKRRIDISVRQEGVEIEELLSDIDTYVSESVNTSHPHFMNPLWGGTNIASFAGEIITALTNTSMYTFEIAPMATLIENEMIETMARLAGYEAGDGIFTTGGSNGNLLGIIAQFGGQTPIKLAKFLHENSLPILGTQYTSIDLAEDRDRFRNLLIKLNLKQAESGIAYTYNQAIKISNKIGLPLVIRPSYVLGGRAMEIVHEKNQLKEFINEAFKASEENPILIDKFINNAMEVDVDAISDGKDVYVAGIMQHIEEAGIHSGDSACCLPPISIKENLLRELKIQTRKLALALKVKGFLNIQFAIKKDEIFVTNQLSDQLGSDQLGSFALELKGKDLIPVWKNINAYFRIIRPFNSKPILLFQAPGYGGPFDEEIRMIKYLAWSHHSLVSLN